MRIFAVALYCAAACASAGQPASPTWRGYGGDAQHTALSNVPAQPLEAILWQAPVDLAPQYNGTFLYIHYAEPMATAANTILIPVKTGGAEGFRIDARNGASGALKWSIPSDYVLAPHANIWVPSYPATLTPQNRLYFAGTGGTVYFVDNPDTPGATVSGQFAFYGLGAYQANPDSYNSGIFICTPLTADAAGNIYFGFIAAPGAPQGLSSGFARVQPDGTGAFISAQAAAGGDASIIKPVYNCAPALSNDGTKVYAAVSNTTSTAGNGRLVELNAATLAYVTSVVLRDPNGALSNLPDDGTASPVIGPDGDVYFGVLENPIISNNFRGWLLHFSADLSVQKITGAFGWDDTPSVVPATMVPSYTGTSSYLLMTKYNNYAGAGTGNGVNKLAVLDPNATQTDPVSGRTVMKEVLTVAGVTPEDEPGNFPNAVREWCINSAVVDPATSSVYAGSEDGKLYRWNLVTNSFTQMVTLTEGIGEAYTPTLIGPDGTIYAINNATLFAVGAGIAPAFTNGPPPSQTTIKMPYTFTYTASGIPAPTFTLDSGVLPGGLSLDPTSGILVGIPSTAGEFTGAVKASNIAGSALQNFSITINPAIVLGTVIANGKVNELYDQTLTASGGTGTKTFALSVGTLPAGLSLNASSGRISGTPAAAGQFSFVVTATDAVGATGQQGYTLSIAGLKILVSPSTLPAAAVGQPYGVQFAASDGIPPYSFSVSGALPPGLTFSNDGLLSGAPTAGGSFSFAVTATDSSAGASFSGTQNETLVVTPAVVSVGPTSLPGAQVGMLYTQILSATGGTAPYSFVLTQGALPAGLTLSLNGVLSGTPTDEGVSSFTITAIDSSTGTGPCSGSRPYTIAVDHTPIFVSGPTANPNPALVDVPVTFTAAADFSDAVITWDFGDGTAPASGPSVQHVYAAQGTYTVTVSAQNPRTLSMSHASLTLSVLSQAFVPGTIPLVAALGTIKLGPAIDQANVTTYFQLPPSQPVQGLHVLFTLAGLQREFVFDAKGKASAADGQARLRLQRFRGRGLLAKLTVNLKGALKTGLTIGGALPNQMVVRVDVNGASYSSVVIVVSKKTRAGAAGRF